MYKLSSKLRIGEKIGLSFGLVSLLFLLVIWRYHATLEHTLAGYRVLQEVYEAKETHATEIENNLLEADAETRAFLVDRAEKRLESVDQSVEKLLGHAERLGSIDGEGRLGADRIKELAQAYQQSFHRIFEAWERKGLDHDSGLQGAFRDTVHELEALAAHYKVDSLYIDLLQIRRGEKDLGLRREPEYRKRVLQLLDGFNDKLGASELEPAIKEQLLRESATYREAFLDYAEGVLDNENIRGGKGPFRQAAHRIEDILVAHRVPDMEAHILQVRRREKDYLLRLDERYVEMTIAELQRIQQSVESSMIADAEKEQLTGLLSDYRRYFLALVEQNRVIDQLQREMQQAADEVLALADATEADANRLTEEATRQINEEAAQNARLMGWIVLLAVLLAILFGVLIARRITRPLIKMAGFLDRLAFEQPVGHIPTVPDSRDEVEAMADSVNRMAEHKASMLAWWKSSLEEMEAERDRWAARTRAAESAESADEADAAAQLREAVAHRAGLLRASHEAMQREARRIDQSARELGAAGKPVSAAAREILSRLDIILAHHEPGK
jgi:methyl-accepting chemotaxis protein